MIRYSLKCAEGHGFESWFQSAEAYDKLLAGGLVICTHCGSSKVEKALMAPRVRPGRKAAAVGREAGALEVSAQAPGQPASRTAPADEATSGLRSDPLPEQSQPTSLRAPSSAREQAIAALRKQVEANSDYVGKDFAKQARDMFLGDTPARAIHGEAKLEEAKALIEDGVPVLPLPFAVNRKVN